MRVSLIQWEKNIISKSHKTAFSKIETNYLLYEVLWSKNLDERVQPSKRPGA